VQSGYIGDRVVQDGGILNSLDLALFRLEVAGTWKVDFANSAALSLMEQSHCREPSMFFKNIIVHSLNKQSFPAVTKLGLLN